MSAQAALNFSGPVLPDEVPRLTKQFDRVVEVMLRGGWMSLREISAASGAPESSASAQARNARKVGYLLEKRRRGPARLGLWEYRLGLVGGR